MGRGRPPRNGYAWEQIGSISLGPGLTVTGTVTSSTQDSATVNGFGPANSSPTNPAQAYVTRSTNYSFTFPVYFSAGASGLASGPK